MKPYLYEATRPFAIVAISLLCKRRVNTNGFSIPEGPLIIASNHLSWLDIPLLGISMPRRISFMAKKEYFDSPFHSFFLHKFGSFTVDRGAVDRKALQKAGEVIKSGYALGIFPEGTRSRNAQLLPARPGVAFIAVRNKAHILPVGISGSEKIRDRYENITHILGRPKVNINVGEPFQLVPAKGKPTREELASFGDLIMQRIAELIPENYQGAYRRKDAN